MKIGVNLTQCSSNRCANFQLKRSKLKVTGLQKLQKSYVV